MPLYDEKLANKRYIKKHYCDVFLKKDPLLHTKNSSVNVTEIESGSRYKTCISYHENFKKAEKVCSKLTAILAEQGTSEFQESMEKLSYLLQITNNHKKWLIVEVCQTSEVDKMVESEDETCSTNKVIIVENDEQQELQLRDQDERQEQQLQNQEQHQLETQPEHLQNEQERQLLQQELQLRDQGERQEQQLQNQQQHQLETQPEQQLQNQQERQPLASCIATVKLPLIRKARGRPKNIDTTVIGIKRLKGLNKQKRY
jgi:hypothetical protein